ncbi:DUF7694 domain-containing protein [Bacillus bombysepticus]|uniref:DUF7694 domain-containing protein n=1 Tax=Bacillus bombysepticus TaxID=658666 RepID=UPI003019A073
MNRAERRRLSRDMGKEGAWERKQSPKEAGHRNGWFGELDRSYSNGKYAVMIRSVKTEWGVVEHACIRNAANTDIPWKDKQKIKDELFGKERTAIEVFPKQSELVDEANMYHIWVLPEGMDLPFKID